MSQFKIIHKWVENTKKQLEDQAPFDEHRLDNVKSNSELCSNADSLNKVNATYLYDSDISRKMFRIEGKHMKHFPIEFKSRVNSPPPQHPNIRYDPLLSDNETPKDKNLIKMFSKKSVVNHQMKRLLSPKQKLCQKSLNKSSETSSYNNEELKSEIKTQINDFMKVKGSSKVPYVDPKILLEDFAMNKNSLPNNTIVHSKPEIPDSPRENLINAKTIEPKRMRTDGTIIQPKVEITQKTSRVDKSQQEYFKQPNTKYMGKRRLLTQRKKL